MVDDVVAVDGGVDDREFLQGVHGGFHEEAHEAQADTVFLLEFFLIFLAQRHHRLHVDLVEGRQDGVGLLGLQQALGHTLAQARHRHALLGTAFEQAIEIDRDPGHRQCSRSVDRRQGRRGGSSRLGGGGQGVTLGDAAVAAGTGHLRRIDALLGQQLGGSRHGRATRGTAGCRGSGLGRCGRLGGRRGLGWSGCLRRSGAGLGFGVDGGDDFVGHHRGAITFFDLDDHAGRRGGQLQHHLVGFDVDQVLVAGNGVAHLLVPLQQGGFRNRFGQLRHFHFDLGHLGRNSRDF